MSLYWLAQTGADGSASSGLTAVATGSLAPLSVWTDSGSKILRATGDGSSVVYTVISALASDTDRATFQARFSVRYGASSSTRRVFWWRAGYSAGTWSGYALVVSNTAISIRRITSANTTVSIASASVGFATNTWYEVEITVSGNSHQVTVWARGSSQPGTPQLSVSDSTYTAAGYIGPASSVSTAADTCDWSSFGVGTGTDAAPTSDPGTILTGAGATAAPAADTGAIQQTHALTGTGTTAGGEAAADAIQQTHALTGAGATGAPEASAGAIPQTHVLDGAGASAEPSAAAGTVEQTHALSGAGASAESAASAGTIQQTHALTGAGSQASPAADSGTVAQTHALTGSGAEAQPAASTGEVLQGAITVLSGDGATATPEASAGVIAQTHTLTGAAATVQPEAGSGPLVQEHRLDGLGVTAHPQASTGQIFMGGVLPLGRIVAPSLARTTPQRETRGTTPARTLAKAA
jgi:hypothetical protein